MTKFNACLLFALVSALLIFIPSASAAIIDLRIDHHGVEGRWLDGENTPVLSDQLR